jgi:anti-anti-sigma factor
MTQANEITIAVQDGILLTTIECAHMEDQHAQALVLQLMAAVEQSPGLPVVLDLSRVTIMPSMSIGVLVTLWRKFQSSGQRFVLAGPQPQVRQTLTVCRLDKLLELCDSVADARRRLGPGVGT